MPLYEFICTACDQVFEEILPANFAQPPLCPRCKRRDDVRQQLCACAVRTSAGGNAHGPSHASCAPTRGFS